MAIANVDVGGQTGCYFMITSQMIEKVLGHCMIALEELQASGQSRSAVEAMRLKIRQIAREVFQWGLTGESKAELILHPLEQKLVARFGPRTGRRLYWKFQEAFWILSLSSPQRPTAKESKPIDILSLPTRL